MVQPVTPQNTLRSEYKDRIDSNALIYFCPSPECSTVYYLPVTAISFSQEQLINRVTAKDPHPETPLCYCYKFTKGAVLQEIRETGSSPIIQQIEQRMQQHPCFCERSNPTGRCCLEPIKQWLSDQLHAQPDL
jgi:hypothetical protein